MANVLVKVWNVLLRRNRLKKDGTVEYFGEVEIAPVTLTNERIAARMVERGSELSKETIQSVLDKKDELVAEALLNCEKVQDGVMHLEPVARGTWPSPDDPFGTGTQKAGVVHSLTAAMRARLKNVRLVSKGEVGDGAYIGGVYIIPSTEKAKTMKRGDDMLVTGEKIGVFPVDDPTMKVYFIDDEGVMWQLDHQLIENKAKRLVFRVPNMPTGRTFTLHVRTRCTGSGKTLLKEARDIVYSEPLTLVASEEPPKDEAAPPPLAINSAKE
jgi:hypothetical protein